MLLLRKPHQTNSQPTSAALARLQVTVHPRSDFACKWLSSHTNLISSLTANLSLPPVFPLWWSRYTALQASSSCPAGLMGWNMGKVTSAFPALLVLSISLTTQVPDNLFPVSNRWLFDRLQGLSLSLPPSKSPLPQNFAPAREQNHRLFLDYIAWGCCDPSTRASIWTCWTSHHWPQIVNPPCPDPSVEPPCQGNPSMW